MKDILFLLFALVKSHPFKTLDDLETRLKTYQNVTGIGETQALFRDFVKFSNFQKLFRSSCKE